MFLSLCSPISSNAKPALPATSSCTRRKRKCRRVRQALQRAATLTPSPKISPSCSMMSPTLIPIGNRPGSPAAGIARGHAGLNFDGAAHRIDDAGELDQQTVAGGLDDPAAMPAMQGSTSSRRCAFRLATCLPRRRPSAGCSRRDRQQGWQRACARRAWPTSDQVPPTSPDYTCRRDGIETESASAIRPGSPGILS